MYATILFSYHYQVQGYRNGLLLFLKGVAMGAANVIPGVSGGTIAFITNIYEQLIDSLKSFDIDAFQLLIKFRFKAFREYVNLDFLLVLPVFQH